jgi:hypothetical protein
MGYPICHTVIDKDENRIVRLVVVSEKGKFTEMTNYGGFFNEKTHNEYRDKNIFDTEKSAIGYLTMPSQGEQSYELSTIEDIDDNKIKEFIDRIKNRK